MCLSVAIAGSHIFALFDSHTHANNPRGPSFTVFRELDQFATILRQRLQESPLTVDPLTNHPIETRSLSAFVLKPIEGAQFLDTEALVIRSASYIQQIQWKSRPSAERSPGLPSAISEHLALLRSRAESLKETNAREFPDKAASSNSTRRSPRGPRDIVRVADHGEFGWQLSLLSHQSTLLSGDDDQQRPTPGDFSLGIRDEESATPIAGSSARSEFDWLTSIAQAQADIVGHHEDEASTAQGLTKNEDTWEVDLVKQLQDEEEITAALLDDMCTDHPWLVALQRLQAEERAKFDGHATSSLSHLELDWQLAVQMQHEDDDGIPRIVIESEGNGVGPVNAESGLSRSNIRADLLRVPVPDRREYGDNFASLTLPSLPLSFHCSICGECHDQAEKLGPSECGHNFCKDCLTYFTRTKIEEGRYPIFCPECLAERSRTSKCRTFCLLCIEFILTGGQI